MYSSMSHVLRLLEFATFHSLVLTNTLGPHKPSRRWVWHSPDGKHRNQTDYILVMKFFVQELTSTKTRTFPEADIGSDHDLVMKEYIGKPSETDSIKSKMSSKTSRGKKYSTRRLHHRHHSDSQVNRWTPASLTFNNYFYIFLYKYITRITINNNMPHLKSPKNQNRRAALGRPAIKITGGL